MLNGWERKVQKLLMDARGRAALKKYGIDVEIAQKSDKPDDKPIVVVMCPTYRSPEPQTRDSVIAMKEYTRETAKAIVYDAPPMSAAVVHWSRNALVQGQLQSGKPWTHALLVDDDMVPEKDDLVKLLAHKKDVVVGICTCRTDPPMPNIKEFDEETGNFGRIWEWPRDRLFEVGGGGTGFMLVTRHAFEQMGQVYLECLWEQDYYGLAGEKLERLKKVRLKKFDEDKTCFWFRFVPNAKGDIEMGEDMGFCYMLRKYCDIKTYADPSVQPGHIGRYAFGIKDFEPYRDDCIVRAKISGEYKMEVPPLKISILCPTRGRPKQVKEMAATLLENSTVPPEIVFYVDDDDPTFPESLDYPDYKVMRGPRIIMGEMWNRCLELATGEILGQSNDDFRYRTKGWDDMVRRAFAAFPDRMICVHGDDGVWGAQFGTHCFLHKTWVETTGYLTAPYFSSDFCDTWFNDVFNAVNRRVFLPFVTEHLHFLANKGEVDKTHQDRLNRHLRDDTPSLYQKLLPKRIEDVRKIRAKLGIPYQESEYAEIRDHRASESAVGA